MSGLAEHLWVVDRVQGSIAVLIRDADGRTADVPVGSLPGGSGEGAVLRVPEAAGRPDWAAAALDEEARLARLREAEDVLRRLRRRDPGGDLKL
ncbi:MAG: DUF3006 domain-containing protein [Gemmatimonadetes bacterium]|nr:DUF3006 domain-containing protein [Candidatus Palauibacter rhopaloidicola]